MRKDIQIAGILLMFALAAWSCGGGGLPAGGSPGVSTVEIVTSSVPWAVVGEVYEVQLEARGGSGLYQWSASGLPPGMKLSGSGVLEGTPTAQGVFQGEIKVQQVTTAGISSEGEATARLEVTVR
jgi:hypothetical protein